MLILLLSLITHPVFAWEKHQAIMLQVTDALPALKRDYLVQKVKVPSRDEEKQMIGKLALRLGLNASKIPFFAETTTTKLASITVRDLIQSAFIDEPDLGMDQNLPDSADPKNERAWMGGASGPTSQGFRHMYFGGLAWSSPLSTFQIPFHAVGQAPDRFEKMRTISNEFFKKGDLFWGVRTLMWALHYAQDLTQPFHVSQVPNLNMVPWNKLFSGFIEHSTHSLGNYHYAYEGLALEYLNEARVSEFNKCFEVFDMTEIQDLTKTAAATREAAPLLGEAVYILFGDEMKGDEVDLPHGKGSIDYYQLLHQRETTMPTKAEQAELPTIVVKDMGLQLDRVNALKKVRTVTCDLMKRVSALTWGELDRAFGYIDNSSSIGK
jgi:hypothetical protein